MLFRKALLHVVAALVGVATTVSSARAAFIANITQSGSNVVLSGSGTIDTAGLGSPTVSTGLAVLVPNTDTFVGGPTVSTSLQYYAGISGGPSYSGLGGGSFPFYPTTGSGDIVALFSFGTILAVPNGYVSGSSLTDTDTYDDLTLAEIGINTGTYTFTWGSGPTADSLTLTVSVPEPATLAMAAVAMCAIGLRRRTRHSESNRP